MIGFVLRNATCIMSTSIITITVLLFIVVLLERSEK